MRCAADDGGTGCHAQSERRSGIDDGVIHGHDALAASSLIDPGVVSLQALHIEGKTRGERTAGETLGLPRHGAPLIAAAADGSFAQPAANAEVALEVDVERFYRLLNERLVGRAMTRRTRRR